MRLLTRNQHDLLDMASLLQKAIRRGDYKKAGYAASEIMLKYRDYLWKRLLTISAEDCYGVITKEILALKESDDFVTKGKDKKSRIFIAKAIILLCYALKNRDSDYFGNMFIISDTIDNDIPVIKINDKSYTDSDILDYELDSIPEYVYDVHTVKGKSKGKTKTMFFADEHNALYPKMKGLFDELQESVCLP